MRWIVRNMKWIMLLSGVLTCTMFYAAIAPKAALMSTFGVALDDGPLSEILVRNWGVLITLMGAMLVYGAYRPAQRPLILIVAGVSKVVFILLLLVYGQAFLGKAGLALVVDLVAVLLYMVYLAGVRQNPS
jgi:hypothetical protein